MNESKNLENKEDLIKRIKELDNSLSIALDLNDKFQRENVKLSKRIEELERTLKKVDPQTKIEELRSKGHI